MWSQSSFSSLYKLHKCGQALAQIQENVIVVALLTKCCKSAVDLVLGKRSRERERESTSGKSSSHCVLGTWLLAQRLVFTASLRLSQQYFKVNAACDISSIQCLLLCWRWGAHCCHMILIFARKCKNRPNTRPYGVSPNSKTTKTKNTKTRWTPCFSSWWKVIIEKLKFKYDALPGQGGHTLYSIYSTWFSLITVHEKMCSSIRNSCTAAFVVSPAGGNCRVLRQ